MSPLLAAQRTTDEIEEDEDDAVYSITIVGKKFKLGKDAESDKELHDLRDLIKRETSHA